MYEVGASRQKNHMHTLMKNTMLIPLVTITWFFFGWWIYWAFPGGPGITGGIGHPIPETATAYYPWGESMVPRLDDRISGVFWAAFLLFAWTAASIVSGAVIERIRKFAFWMIAILIGSRQCCEQIDRYFETALNDLHNLAPAVGQVNTSRVSGGPNWNPVPAVVATTLKLKVMSRADPGGPGASTPATAPSRVATQTTTPGIDSSARKIVSAPSSARKDPVPSKPTKSARAVSNST